ncbi:hypothetical protein IC229_28955 [Spirosoma sp. BT702]|uniref:Uncharacterized protein n=1 Tax=Spirosoma profusum TaxID=2771354 RepID=A0A927AUL6_9BACT|nr:hypothetical protein [Spirosoma profusum]MBD2704700.1 hypothetical protein [Spirosoma profusum]
MSNILWHNLSWYVYLGFYLVMCLKRHDEIKREPGVFDFARYSLSAGYIHPRFLMTQLNGKPVNIRTIETLLEPALFFFIGIGLCILGQKLGILLIVCSLVYSISYQAAYHQGDNFVMDKIDEIICNEELVKAFVDGRDPSETRGFNFYGRRPADPETRRQLAETFVENEETVVAM